MAMGVYNFLHLLNGRVRQAPYPPGLATSPEDENAINEMNQLEREIELTRRQAEVAQFFEVAKLFDFNLS